MAEFTDAGLMLAALAVGVLLALLLAIARWRARHRINSPPLTASKPVREPPIREMAARLRRLRLPAGEDSPLLSLAVLLFDRDGKPWEPCPDHHRLAVCLRARVGDDFRTPEAMEQLFNRINKYAAKGPYVIRNILPEGESAFALSSACDLLVLVRWPAKKGADQGIPGDASRVAARLIERYKKGGEDSHVASKASAGWAYAPPNSDLTLRQLIARAEVAVRSKTESRPYDPQYKKDNTGVAPAIQSLIRTRDYLSFVHMAYQPKYRFEQDLGHWVLCGAEALLRFSPPEGYPTCTPYDLIKAVRHAGGMKELNRHIVTVAARMATMLNKLLNRDDDEARLKVSVNLSPADFTLQLINDLHDTMHDDPALLESDVEIEILEDTTMTSECLEAAQAAHGYGFGLALDDYGTQQSNLDRLSAFTPLRPTIKLDRQIILDALGGNSELREQLRAIVAVARNGRFPVIAEGVPDEADAQPVGKVLCGPAAVASILELGITEIQGFVFARPMSREAIERLIREGNRGLSSSKLVHGSMQQQQPATVA
jgi:EAL domain-containing protein (putative c-di-GMP-specific phosphodiesterase class I)